MLSSEQQKELETAIFNYLMEKGYHRTADILKEESKLLSETIQHRSEERVLERKWFTIVKLQSKIIELEKRLAQTEEIIAKSVRSLVVPPEGQENGEEKFDSPVLKLTKVYKGHKDTVTCVAIHASEPFFASGSSDSTIRLVDYELKNNLTVLKGHTHSVNCLTWARDELISGSSDMSIKIWKSGNKTNPLDLNDFYCHKTLLGHEHIVSGLVTLQDTEFTISVSRDRSIRIWDRLTGFCRKTISDAQDEWIRCCDANSKYLITSGNDKKLFVFDLKQLLDFDKQGENSGAHCHNCFLVHENFVDSVKLYKDGKLGEDENVAITASRDKSIGVWNFLNGALLVRLTGHENWVKDLALFENYNYLLSVGDDKTLRIWDLKKRKQLFLEANAHDHFVTCVTLHKEFRVVLTGSVDKQTKIWKVLNSNSNEFMLSMVH